MMAELFFNKISKPIQSLLGISFVGIVSLVCAAFSPFIGYRVVAFLLLLTVSLLAISFDILPVLLAAVLSALVWNFFFIPPRFTLHVDSADDLILFVMYFIISLVNAGLTYKIRLIQKGAKQREEKASTLKLYNTILNSLSHELRTPIATIIGSTDILLANNTRLNPDNRGELLAEISKASFRLNQQVENLLSISRLESGYIRPKLDWCDINEIVYEAIKRVEEYKYTQKISVNINPNLPLFKLDKGMLEQVIYNLLNNACLYTPWNSEINVTSVCHTNILEIIIEDNGYGFPDEEMGKVFDKFYRLKDSKTGGTGLGLSIVKGFIEALGGRIYLENVRTGGARFTIHIPAETVQINRKPEVWLRRKF